MLNAIAEAGPMVSPVGAMDQGDERPVDLAHLARQTMGNRDLEREVLHLFLRQCERMLERISSPAAARAELAHVIQGSARGIGAHRVAEAAEVLEAAAKDEAADWDAALARLRSEVDRATGFIRTVALCA